MTLLALAALCGHVGGASAEGRSGTAYISDIGSPTAEARDVASPSVRPTQSPRSVRCTWRAVLSDDTSFAIYDELGNRQHSETGRWLERWCEGAQVLVGGSYAAPERARVVSPAALAQEAIASVPIPDPPIVTSPRADRRLYTRVPTWLWLDDGWWQEYSATAEAGGVTTTVSAVPARAVWSMGDGGQTICAGPGVEWRAGLSEAATSCSYLYKNSSGGQRDGTFKLTVSVEFDVSWTSNIDPGGALPRIVRSASRTVEVGEIQAVETR